MRQEGKKTIWNLIAKMLAGEASPEELLELEKLLKENPDLHYPVQMVNDLWHTAKAAETEEAELAFDRHLERLGNLEAIRPVRRRARLIAGLSMFSMILLAAIWLTFRSGQIAKPAIAGQQAASTHEVSTANGARIRDTLPDGTLVWLNAGSRLVYGKEYNKTRREVYLTGEAFFDVAKNKQKPFLIHTDRIDIQVLGTSFNIKSYPLEKTTEATLIRGSIEISLKDRPSERFILKPNQKLVVGGTDSLLHPAAQKKNSEKEEPLVAIRKPTYEQNTGTVIETSWVNNTLIFKEEAFSDLARQMERWYGITIAFSDPGLQQLEFTGSFKGETIRQALEALKLTATFNYDIRGNEVTINK
jgi:transmembrane sensor